MPLGTLSPIQILKQNRTRAIELASQAGGPRTRALLEKAQKELEERLRKAEGLGGPGKDSFTANQTRIALEQVRDVLRSLKKNMSAELVNAGKKAAQQATLGTIAYLQAGEKHFTGSATPLALKEAVMLDRVAKGTESSLLHRISTDPTHPGRQGILDRYGDAVVSKFEEQLQLRFITGRSWAETRDAIVAESDFLKGAPAHWAERIVRTEVMGAHGRAGWESIRLANQQLGDMLKILSATFDHRTACLTGDARVTAGMVRAIFRRWYEGSVVKIVTERGRKLTTTPNHPMLTGRGWVPSGELSCGDDLICNRRDQCHGPSGDQNKPNPPPSIAQVFDSLAVTGDRERRRGRQEDFHGDGRDGNVDVLWPDCELRLGQFSPIDKPQAKRLFAPPDNVRFCECGALRGPGIRGDSFGLRARTDSHTCVSQSAIYEFLRDVITFPDTLDRLARLVSAGNFPGGHIVAIAGMPSRLELQFGGLGCGAGDAASAELFGHVPAVDVHRCGDLGQGHSCQIERDRVVDIQIATFAGHIFNLWTGDGYFTAEGAFTANSDSYAVHGQIRRPDEAFESWHGLYQHPPDRPNDREVVVPHRAHWPIPKTLQPKSDGEIAARWAQEGRKGSPPPRPLMSTVDLAALKTAKPATTAAVEQEQPTAKPERRASPAQVPVPEQLTRTVEPEAPKPKRKLERIDGDYRQHLDDVGVSYYIANEETPARIFGGDPPAIRDLEATWGAAAGFDVKVLSVQTEVYDNVSQIQYTGRIEKDGKAAGSIIRSFRRHPDGKLEVHHDLFKIGDPKLQGGGLGESMLRQSIEAYSDLGVDEITVDTAWIGKYTWASFGYNWDKSTSKRISEQLSHFLKKHGVDPKRAEKIAKRASVNSWDVAALDVDGITVATSKDEKTGEERKEKIGKAFLLQGTSWSGTLKLDPSDPTYQRAKKRLKL